VSFVDTSYLRLRTMCCVFEKEASTPSGFFSFVYGVSLD
jgi:hypothetical protein